MSENIDMYDFCGECNEIYSRTCSCGNVIEVSTQRDIRPEYYTDVFVKCGCGCSVRFKLPVN